MKGVAEFSAKKLFIVLALVAAASAQLSSEYLPPVAASTTYEVAANAPVAAAAAPVTSYLAPAASFDTVEIAAPAHSYSNAEGYRYKTQKRRIVKTARRHRRDVSTEYLPPVAASTTYEVAAAAPVTSYLAPAASFDTVEVAAPAHSFSDAEGYRYKTQKRRVVKTARRHRRDVATEYLPPVAASTTYEVAAAAPVVAAASPDTSYLSPAASFDTVEVAAPAHSFSDAEGYRYKTQKRRVVKTARRHRRDVSTEYLPPVAASTTYEVAAAPVAAAAAPVTSYLAPAASFDTVEVAAPAHSFSDAEGYRYKTQKRRVVKTARRHRRDVSTEYLPPVAASTTYEVAAAAPATSYLAPAASFDTVEVAAPAHSFSDAEGYRYKTHRSRVLRRHRI
ncbi:uncharacterized protein LOC131807170 [Musca domestica]|uniref:Uncharacterized protein LOC131807170 n=1 Tax=Musca domestica TaxID=7370 RepID=A0ABM3VQV1_MUSDO|nr:uncharacterized protein LOC131807170 [Musca domestica]